MIIRPRINKEPKDEERVQFEVFEVGHIVTIKGCKFIVIEDTQDTITLRAMTFEELEKFDRNLLTIH